MTLSSRDPHLGQRIVWKSPLAYYSLWCQRFSEVHTASRELKKNAKAKTRCLLMSRDEYFFLSRFSTPASGTRSLKIHVRAGGHAALTRYVADGTRIRSARQTRAQQQIRSVASGTRCSAVGHRKR